MQSLLPAGTDEGLQADVLDLLIHLLSSTTERLEGPLGTGSLEADTQLLSVRVLSSPSPWHTLWLYLLIVSSCNHLCVATWCFIQHPPKLDAASRKGQIRPLLSVSHPVPF